MSISEVRIREIYKRLRRHATFKVLALLVLFPVVAQAAPPTPVVWTGAQHVAAGDSFLVLGYSVGLEVWAWYDNNPIRRTVWKPGAEVAGLWAHGTKVAWVTADSALHTATVAGEDLVPLMAAPTAGEPIDVSASESYIGVLTDSNGTTGVRVWEQGNPAATTRWIAPGGGALTWIALRDSTLAGAGGNRVWLARLRGDTAVTMDSLLLTVYVYKMAWAGDTLLLALATSGLKVVGTEGDQFADSIATYSDGGLYQDLAVWDRGWAAIDLFGRLLTFERGSKLEPASLTTSDGTSRGMAAGRDQLAVLTTEYGLGMLDVFSPQLPFWTERRRLPGFVRSLAYSDRGMLAHADYVGVLQVDTAGFEPIMANPYNVVDLSVAGNLVAATGFLTGTALYYLDGEPVQEPLATVHSSIYSRVGELGGNDQLYTVTTAGCDSGFSVYDISNPAEPKTVTRWSVCVPIRDLERMPGALATAMGDSGVWIYDTPIVDTTDPVAVGGATRRWVQLAWRDGYLWGRADNGDIVRWAWRGDSLVELDRFAVPDCQWFDVSGDKLALAHASRLADVWRWDSGGALEAVATFPTRRDVKRVAIVADTVWYVDFDIVYRDVLEGGAGIDDDGAGPVLPRAAILGPCYPNPFNGATQIPLKLRPGVWQVSIYNILGQHVTSWSGLALGPEQRTLVWHPEAGSEPARASGVYFVRATSGGQSEIRRVVYLK